VLEQMRMVSGKSMGVFNNAGMIIASIGKTLSEDVANDALLNVTANGKPFTMDGYSFVAFGLRNTLDYVAYIHGDDADAQKICQLLSVSLSSLQLHCGDKYDKINCLKNILLGNVLPGDVSMHSAELQIDTDIPCVVYIVQTQEPSEASVQHILQNMFPEQDFVISIDNLNVVLVKCLPANYNRDMLNKIAKSIVETVSSELMIPVYVGVGTPTDSLQEIARSYSEAKLALEIGRVFEGDRCVLSYDALGIGRLIYQLPRKLCELFLDEIFKKESINVLDEEIIQTIYKFFENNLNVSETSRQLFVHRNTLVYRLDKIERLTGLDLRKFDDAVIFKVAILVNKYLHADTAKF